MRQGSVRVMRNGECRRELPALAAQSFIERSRGLLGRPALKGAESLWIAPCNAIHTWFMRYAIDVIFLSRDGEVRKLCPGVAPWRMAACLPAHSVLEMAAKQIAANDIQCGDRIQWCD